MRGCAGHRGLGEVVMHPSDSLVLLVTGQATETFILFCVILIPLRLWFASIFATKATGSDLEMIIQAMVRVIDCRATKAFPLVALSPEKLIFKWLKFIVLSYGLTFFKF